METSKTLYFSLFMNINYIPTIIFSPRKIGQPIHRRGHMRNMVVKHNSSRSNAQKKRTFKKWQQMKTQQDHADYKTAKKEAKIGV